MYTICHVDVIALPDVTSFALYPVYNTFSDDSMKAWKQIIIQTDDSSFKVFTC